MKKTTLLQQPQWPNQKIYQQIIRNIASYPQLVFPSEIENLKVELREVAEGKRFIIQGGDCAETFKNFSETMIKNKLKILLQMSAIVQYTTQLKIVNIGRIAGQYIKPRTHNTETRGNQTLPSYRGDGVNSIDFKRSKRTPNPKRLLRAYHQSAATMNLIRSLIMNGFTDIKQIQLWNRDLLNHSPLGKKYNSIVMKIIQMITFIEQSGFIHRNDSPSSELINFYTSHEAILLDYERAFIEQYKNKKYCCSTNMLWVGDRTRNAHSEHIKFVANLENPIGIKVGPSINVDDLLKIYEQVNPKHEKGKLSFIVRLGANKIEKILPSLISKINYYGCEVLWVCDPMHGNTIKAKNGYKTRRFDTIIEELTSFFNIFKIEKMIPGGIHVELTGENVTECLGGINNIKDVDLDQRYETTCDPRLNNEQSLEIAFLISKLLKKGEKELEKITN